MAKRKKPTMAGLKRQVAELTQERDDLAAALNKSNFVIRELQSDIELQRRKVEGEKHRTKECERALNRCRSQRDKLVGYVESCRAFNRTPLFDDNMNTPKETWLDRFIADNSYDSYNEEQCLAGNAKIGGLTAGLRNGSY